MPITIDVNNVGPIHHARLSIGQLNVLIGVNDTGKTFFSTIVHRLLVSRSDAYFPNRLSGESIPDKVIDVVERIQACLGDDEDQPVDVEFRIDDSVRAWANEINESTLQRYGQGSRHKVASAYGLPIEKLRRQPTSYSKHESYISIENLNPRWSMTIPIDVDRDCTVTCPDPDIWIRTVFSPENVRRFTSYPSYSDPRLTQRQDSDSTPRQRVSKLCERILYFMGDTTLFWDWPDGCLHLPSERGGIMQSYRVITSAALRKIAVAGIEPIEIEPLDGTARDFLAFIIAPEAEHIRRPEGEVFVDLASEVEHKLRTKIEVIRSPSGIDGIVAITPEGEFQLNQSSSMISELSPLVLALKHRLSVGDYLTIDEPEAHLHPEMQIEIARLLVSLASAGLTITFTTHSDYFLEQVNNAIRSNELMTQMREKEGVPDGSRIGYRDVRALLFGRDNDGCSASDNMGDVTYPIGEDTFTAASRRQYEESIPLINELLARSRVPQGSESSN